MGRGPFTLRRWSSCDVMVVFPFNAMCILAFFSAVVNVILEYFVWQGGGGLVELAAWALLKDKPWRIVLLLPDCLPEALKRSASAFYTCACYDKRALFETLQLRNRD